MDEEAEVDAEEMADEVGAADVEEDEMYYHGGDAAGQVSLTLTLPLPLTLTLTRRRGCTRSDVSARTGSS